MSTPNLIEMRRRVDDSRTAISKSISAILRRDAKQIGLEIDDDGWVKLSDLLATDVMKGIDEAKLLTVVQESNTQKLRYELTTTEDGQAIRAINKRNVRDGKCGQASSQSRPSVIMSVAGLGGPICEVPIRRGSTVMDARKAIFGATGIPLQQQQLILGCMKLTDSSAKLPLNALDEQIHVTCVHSGLDSEDVCTWCCDILGVPVELICNCKTLYCVTCIRDMTGLNGQPAKCEMCPTCGTRLCIGVTSASKVYKKRLDLIAHLDQKYGEVECPRSCGEFYHRSNAQEHMDICPCTVKICTACWQSYTGRLVAHQVQCWGEQLEDL